MQYQGIPIGWPLDSNVIRRNSNNNTFGMVRKNSDNSPRPHQGWDFYAKVGTICYAIADGHIAYVGDAGDLGLMVVVSIEGTGKYAAYCHLQHTALVKGTHVLLGQPIGFTGNSGNASSMQGGDEHLHFEVRDKPLTGMGLADRVSPLEVFGVCPLHTPITRFPL